MKRFIMSALLAASVCQLSAHQAAAEQPAKGAPTKGTPTPSAGPTANSAYDGPVVVLSALKPGDAVRVKWQNEWTDGKVIGLSGSQLRVQIGGNQESFFAEKVWGTLEARDNEAAGGYLDPTTRENFELFKVAVDKLEAAKRSGNAEAVEAARDEADSILTRDYGKAGQHPRVGPVMVRYWAVAIAECDELVAEAVAGAKKASETNDGNYFNSSTYGALGRAEAVFAEYKQFQTTANAETARLDKLLADAHQTIDAVRAQIAAAALAEVRVPKEIYKGADKKKLKAKITAAWKAEHPDKPILKLVISTNWVHDRDWRTNNSAAGGYWYDWTSLAMDLVVKKDATLATIYPVGVSYQNGNKKNLVISVSDQGFGNWVPNDMLLKNVK